MAINKDESQPGRPFGVADDTLKKLRDIWLASEPGEPVFRGPVIREMEFYFNTSLTNTEFGLENFKARVANDPELLKKIIKLQKRLAVCAEVAKNTFSAYCAFSNAKAFVRLNTSQYSSCQANVLDFKVAIISGQAQVGLQSSVSS